MFSSSAACPSSSAANAVTNLKIEPGGYVARSALSMNGLRGSLISSVYSALVRWPVITFGSNEGLDTIARILPVFDLDHHDRGRRRVRHRLLGEALQVAVEGEHQVRARHRIDHALALDQRSGGLVIETLATRVDRVALDALLAAQVVLPRGLEPVAADELARVVCRRCRVLSASSAVICVM